MKTIKLKPNEWIVLSKAYGGPIIWLKTKESATASESKKYKGHYWLNKRMVTDSFGRDVILDKGTRFRLRTKEDIEEFKKESANEEKCKSEGCKNKYTPSDFPHRMCWQCFVEGNYTQVNNKMGEFWSKVSRFKGDIPKRRIAEIILKDVMLLPPILKGRPKSKRIRKNWEKELNKVIER